MLTFACGIRTLVPVSRVHVEEPFDLLVDAADRLNFAMLVHRSGHRQILPQRDVRQRRQQGIEFGGRRAVALDAAIGLLEHEACE